MAMDNGPQRDLPALVTYCLSNRPDIEEWLRPSDSHAKTSLELSSYHISQAVNAFIDFKVSKLMELKAYETKLRDEIRSYLYVKADETFLWVAELHSLRPS
jgi:hypothetical protein